MPTVFSKDYNIDAYTNKSRDPNTTDDSLIRFLNTINSDRMCDSA